MASNDIDTNEDIVWKPNTTPRWPGIRSLRRDPGDSASVDWGVRSNTRLRLVDHGAEFVCSHARVRVSLNSAYRHLRLTEDAWTRLVLYLAYLGYTCDCFRARWVRVDPSGRFCRAAAKATWRWIEKRIPGGAEAFAPTWEVRDPTGPAFRGRDVLVYDGLFPDYTGRTVPRKPSPRSLRAAGRASQ